MCDKLSECVYQVGEVELKMHPDGVVTWNVGGVSYRWVEGVLWFRDLDAMWVQLARLHAWELGVAFAMGVNCCARYPGVIGWANLKVGCRT